MGRFRFNENDAVSKKWNWCEAVMNLSSIPSPLSTGFYHRDAVMNLSQHLFPFAQRVPGALGAARNHLVPLQILLHIAQRVLVHPKPQNVIVAILFAQIT